MRACYPASRGAAMAKARLPHPNQLSLLDALAGGSSPGAAALAWGQRLRALMVEAIRASGLSREQVAERLARVTNDPITVHMLNAWLAPSKDGHRFPAEYLPALCSVTGNTEILRDAIQTLGGRMASADDLLQAELGRVYRKRLDAERRERALLTLLEPSR